MIGHVSQVRLPVRTTYATATQMIQGASEEIIVVGYVFTEGASALVELLAAAQTDRKVLVTIIGNRMRDQLSRLKGMWPAVTPLPAVFSRERLADDPLATLHAKLLLCDRSEALVTSANFSHHGLHANIEIGLHVKSPAIERLSDFLLALINSGEVDSLTEVL
ncbi:MAG: phospholipase D-like domain-containing protein [Thermoguttaceae bacterium]|jgi:phosphatidylserine/phosphatidylglycerophosphate/cardiolipin synthase-like enzyme